MLPAASAAAPTMPKVAPSQASRVKLEEARAVNDTGKLSRDSRAALWGTVGASGGLRLTKGEAEDIP